MNARKRVVGFGELLMRLDAPGHRRLAQARSFRVYYTGAETNALVTLVNLGMEGYVVSRVPANEIGQACLDYIAGFGVNTDHVVRGGRAARLGILYVEAGIAQRSTNVIYDRAGSAFTELEVGALDWAAILQGKGWLHFSGTAPALSERMPEVVAEACVAAQERGIPVSCDLNYRSKLWPIGAARAVMTDLLDHIDVLICNAEQAQSVLGIEAAGSGGRDGSTTGRHHSIARQLGERYGLRYVALTQRHAFSATVHDWSAVLYDGRACYQSQRYRVDAVDRIGAGDAFSGGLIYGLLAGLDMQPVVDLAVAVSCLKHTVHGDFNLASRAEVGALLSENPSASL